MTARKTHGLSRTGTYQCWADMLRRCRNSRRPEYVNYGGRGISVCARWERFENFLADMGQRPEGLTLDRRDNGKGYSKSNCRWATYREQLANRRPQKSRALYGGKTINQWAQEWSIPYHSAKSRLYRAGVPRETFPNL